MPLKASKQQLVLLNTRPCDQAKELTTAIKKTGGRCIEFPLLAIAPLASNWLNHLHNLNQNDLAIFISQNAVNCVFKQFDPKRFTLPCIAIGEATKNSLIKLGIHQVTCPLSSSSEHLLNLLDLTNITNKSILLFKGYGGRQLIADTLRKNKARITTIDVYQRKKNTYTQEQCQNVWQNNAITTTLFTSIESLQHAIDLFGQSGLTWLQQTPSIVISDRIKHYATTKGMQHITVIPANSLINSLTRCYDGY